MRKRATESQRLDIEISDVLEREKSDGTVDVTFETSDGELKAIYHPVPGARAGVVLVSGAGGGFDGPASVYADLAREVAPHRVATLRLDYRHRNDLDQCVLDALVGVEYLLEQGIKSVGFVGWSFGGAVAINAGLHENVKAIATVATQSSGTEAANQLGDKPILLLHGSADSTLPVSCSVSVHESASGPKEICVFEGANHGLDQVRQQMLEKLRDFLVSKFA